MNLIDLESEGGRIKSLCVLIGNSFRSSRPDHDFTRYFNEIESHLYALHEQVIKLKAENLKLKMNMSKLEESEDDIEFDMSLKPTNSKPIQHIDDGEWLAKPMQSKTFNDEPDF